MAKGGAEGTPVINPARAAAFIGTRLVGRDAWLVLGNVPTRPPLPLPSSPCPVLGVSRVPRARDRQREGPPRIRCLLYACMRGVRALCMRAGARNFTSGALFTSTAA